MSDEQSNPENPYAAPTALAQPEPQESTADNFDGALRGDYDFTTEGVLREAWALTKGFKLTAWGAIFVYAGLSLAITAVANFVFDSSWSDPNTASQIFQQLLNLLLAPVYLGMAMLGVRRAAGLSTSVSELFQHFSWKPIATVALIYLILPVALVALVLPAIYLGMGYTMAFPLLGDRKLSPWGALEASRKAIHHKWFRVFGLHLAAGVVLLLSMIPFGIGLIWTLPWMFCVSGVLYKSIYGVATTA